MRILTTLSRADSGAARVAGNDVLADPGAVRRAIGCVGQRSGVDLEATGVENLILQGQIHGLRGREPGGAGRPSCSTSSGSRRRAGGS